MATNEQAISPRTHKHTVAQNQRREKESRASTCLSQTGDAIIRNGAQTCGAVAAPCRPAPQRLAWAALGPGLHVHRGSLRFCLLHGRQRLHHLYTLLFSCTLCLLPFPEPPAQHATEPHQPASHSIGKAPIADRTVVDQLKRQRATATGPVGRQGGRKLGAHPPAGSHVKRNIHAMT